MRATGLLFLSLGAICLDGPLLSYCCRVNAVVLPRGGRTTRRSSRLVQSSTSSTRRTSPPSHLSPPPFIEATTSRGESSSTSTTTSLQATTRENGDFDEDDDDEAAASSTTVSRRNLVLTLALSAIAFVATDAKLGLLSGPLASDGFTVLPYSNSLIFQDVGLTALTASLGYIFVKMVTSAGDRGWIEPKDSRKIIHTLSAPLFMLFWPFFSPAIGSKFFAAIVPTLNAARLFLASSGKGETSLRKAVSRSGDAKEALGGPFIYVCILSAFILLFWRSSPVSIVALSTMAAGDGLADLIGRRLGANNQWPGLNKSVAGSLAFWLASLVTSVGLLWWSTSSCHFFLLANLAALFSHPCCPCYQQCSTGAAWS